MLCLKQGLGKGGLDLYECILTDNGVKGPNALHSVNTAMDDISPFYDQFTKRLYFSSMDILALEALTSFTHLKIRYHSGGRHKI